ncbi:MAG TPA: hypothetical protein PKD54_02435, partial [Pirellulaceae bacterium]|nr:hypothetical protein [Pirellulaceae bacterium]
LVVLRWKSGSFESGAQVVVSPLSQMAPGIEVQIGNGPAPADESVAPRDVPGNANSLSRESDVGT